MSWLHGLGGLIGIGAQQQGQAGDQAGAQQGTAAGGYGQTYGGYFQQGLAQQLQGSQLTPQQLRQYFGIIEPTVTYEPMYPIAIKHKVTGKKLIVWED